MSADTYITGYGITAKDGENILDFLGIGLGDPDHRVIHLQKNWFTT
jgi:hypothetical protein